MRLHPVERVQAYCGPCKPSSTSAGDEATDGLGKALSDVLMQMHNQARVAHLARGAGLSDVDAVVARGAESEQRWEEERRSGRGRARGLVAV